MALDFGQGSYYSGFGAYCKAPFCGMNYCSDSFAYVSTHLEVYAVAYNVTNFRSLWEILSDGTTGGNNITATSVAATSSANNLKTDSLEKYCLFAAGVRDVTITIDAERSISWDTFGLLGNNLTAGSSIAVSYSDDNVTYVDNGTIPAAPSGEINTIYCRTAASSSRRYWKFRIIDTNNNSDLRIGRIVFGLATVFDGENFTSQLSFTTENYVEEENMNGFESAFRQRAIRNVLNLTFENLNVSGGNYNELRRYIRYARTTLRALIIPDPANPYRYSVWAKLAKMPTEKHNSLDSTTTYASIDMEWNEGR